MFGRGKGFSMELTQELLDGLLSCAEALYVIEETSRTIVYASCFPCKSKSGGAFVGEKCYSAFLGRSEPCPFCPSLRREASKDDAPYAWDYFYQPSRQWLKIKNRLITSGGVQYRVGNVNVINDMMGLGSDAVREVGQMQRLVRERDDMREQLLYEVSHDRLTGLYNRNQYNRDLEDIYQVLGACGILYFDLNNLKEANDTYNHSEGDVLLQRMAAAILSVTGRAGKTPAGVGQTGHDAGDAGGTGQEADGAARRERSLCAPDAGSCGPRGQSCRGYRVGGDEFVLIWTGCSRDELRQCREDVLRELEVRNRGQRLACSVAVGCAWSGRTEDLEQLVLEADGRMYEEKRRIKNHGAE